MPAGKKVKVKKQNVAELLRDLPDRIAIAIAQRDSPLADLTDAEGIAREILTKKKVIDSARCDHRWGLPFIKIRGKILYSREAVRSHIAKFQIDPTAPQPRRRTRVTA